MNYKQISYEERVKIDFLWNQEKKSITEISKILKRNKSTISREIRRNVDEMGYYSSQSAQEKFKLKQKHKYCFKLFKD